MIPYWVHTADGKTHHLGAVTPSAAPQVLMFSEVIEWYENRFGSPVEWIAVDSIYNVIWEAGGEDRTDIR